MLWMLRKKLTPRVVAGGVAVLVVSIFLATQLFPMERQLEYLKMSSGSTHPVDAILYRYAKDTFRWCAYLVAPAAILFGFYATPIIYWQSLVEGKLPDWAYSLYMLNPMAGIVTAYRIALFGSEDLSVAPLLVWPAIAAVCVLFVGVVVFRKNTPVLADNL